MQYIEAAVELVQVRRGTQVKGVDFVVLGAGLLAVNNGDSNERKYTNYDAELFNKVEYTVVQLYVL